jgi:peptide/nickel transport system permease protein
MVGYVLRRALQAVPVLFIASLGVFLVLRLVPGDPAEALAGHEAPPERVEEIREQLGLNESLPVQYLQWVGDLGQGDLGTSFRNGTSVVRLLKLSLPPTIELALASYAVALLVGIPLGVAAGVRPHSFWDWTLSAYTVVTIGIPSFLAGILLLWLFSVELHWVPTAGRVSFISDPLSSVRYLVLPALALGTGIGAVLARYTRQAVADVMGQDYVRTARAKGLAEYQVVIRHALRSALIPIITIIALLVGQTLAGAVVVERVFTRPGMGRMMIEAITYRDYLVVQSTLIVLVIAFVAANLAADIASGLLDPRARQQ